MLHYPVMGPKVARRSKIRPPELERASTVHAGLDA